MLVYNVACLLQGGDQVGYYSTGRIHLESEFSRPGVTTVLSRDPQYVQQAQGGASLLQSYFPFPGPDVFLNSDGMLCFFFTSCPTDTFTDAHYLVQISLTASEPLCWFTIAMIEKDKAWLSVECIEHFLLKLLKIRK